MDMECRVLDPANPFFVGHEFTGRRKFRVRRNFFFTSFCKFCEEKQAVGIDPCRIRCAHRYFEDQWHPCRYSTEPYGYSVRVLLSAMWSFSFVARPGDKKWT